MAAKTGVQLNAGYTATDDFITRTWILPLLADKAKREALIEEHRQNPIGRPGKAGKPAVQHSDDLARVIDKFRRAPMAGKYVRICVVPHKAYAIGVLSGVRGKPVKMLDNQTYDSEEACEHAIFLRRVDDLLAAYGVKK
jgi:branched-chain amino acid transport system permease protein